MNGVGRHVQHRRCFFHRQAAEEAQLDDAAFALVELRERMERIVQRFEVLVRVTDNERLVQRNLMRPTTAFLVVAGAGVIDEDPPHDAGADRVEVRAILPGDGGAVDQPDIRLVEQGGGLVAVSRALTGHAAPGDPVQLTLDERHQPLEGILVALSPLEQERGHTGGMVRNAPFYARVRFRDRLSRFCLQEALTMKRTYLLGIATASALLATTVFITATPKTASVDAEVIVEWNQILQSTLPGNLGPTAPRYYAMLHVAMFDAANAIEREYSPFHVAFSDRAGGSAEAAAAQAARDVLSGLFPASTSIYDAALVQRFGADPSGFVRRGMDTGSLVAAAVLAWRQTDGWVTPTPPPYVLPLFPGLWQPTPPGNSPAGLTQAPHVVPFAVLTPTQFLPGPPPTVTSARYAADLNETRAIGKSDSAVRTLDQTAVARLWAGAAASGTGTATGMSAIWNNIARDMVRQRGLSLVEAARLFALLNVSVHDGIQTSATAKLVYGLWRPVTAIRRGDEDANVATDSDPAWASLIGTPPYPSYPGNMASVGASAARALALAVGADDIPITATWRQSGGQPDVVRHYAGLSAVAEEQARSRVYGGIHFQFDSDAGHVIGTKVSDYVAAHFMRPLK